MMNNGVFVYYFFPSIRFLLRIIQQLDDWAKLMQTGMNRLFGISQRWELSERVSDSFRSLKSQELIFLSIDCLFLLDQYFWFPNLLVYLKWSIKIFTSFLKNIHELLFAKNTETKQLLVSHFQKSIDENFIFQFPYIFSVQIMISYCVSNKNYCELKKNS